MTEQAQDNSQSQAAQLTQMLESLRLAERQRERYASSDEDSDEDAVPNAERGTLKTGALALEKIMASRFDERDQTKLEFLNLFHTFKNFKLNAKKTASDSLLYYLKLMLDVVNYIDGP